MRLSRQLLLYRPIISAILKPARNMLRTISLGIVLFLFWLALSGHYTTFLVGAGAIVVALCLVIAARMSANDREGHPVHLLPSGLLYMPWLMWEILKSAWNVTLIIIDPRLPISPTMTRVRATQKTSVGIVVYANSITLTPGTITTDVSGHNLIIHAIAKDGADDLEGGAMDQKVTAFEGQS